LKCAHSGLGREHSAFSNQQSAKAKIKSESHLQVAFFLWRKSMTRQQIIDAVRECTEKLGHVPSHTELAINTAVTRKLIRWHFGTYAQLLRECNLEKRGGGFKVEMEALLRDWAGIARALQKMPSLSEYKLCGQYSITPLLNRFQTWTQVPAGLKKYIEDRGRAEEWKDVLELIGAQEQPANVPERVQSKRRARNDLEWARAYALNQGPGDERPGNERPDNERLQEGPGDEPDAEGPTDVRKARRRGVYGGLMRFGPMVCAPTNEQGVLFLFGATAEKLGFAVLKLGTEYPDCEAFRVVEGDRLERVKIEFEFESRNFLKHLHDAKRCDLIVCWRHNWTECPLPVIELKSVTGLLDGRESHSKPAHAG
jgi:hypothetical protein